MKVRWNSEHEEDDLCALTNTRLCDQIMIALDRMGWRLVQKGLEPGEVPRKWPLNFHTEHCPDWCSSVEELAATVKPKPKPELVWSEETV
jgi:hypothetical protein